MIINSGWHGAPPVAVLYCEASATAGRILIPRAIVEALPVIGGMGLFPHGSFIAVTRSVNVPVDNRIVEVSISRRAALNPLHNAPEK
jgi:hypothetical protein